MIKKAIWLSLLAGSAAFAQETSGAASKLAPGGAAFFTWLAIVSVAGMVLAAIGVAAPVGRLVCFPDLIPGLESESGYFQLPYWRRGHGTERQVDGGDHRLLA